MHQHLLSVILGIAVALAIVLILAVAVGRRHGRRSGRFRVAPLSSDYVDPYRSRLDELEKLFVNQPREAAATARLLVDDMLNRMGYPVRMSSEERVRDIRSRDRKLAGRYRAAVATREDATTEQLRRSVQAHLAIAHSLLDRAGRRTKREPGETGTA